MIRFGEGLNDQGQHRSFVVVKLALFFIKAILECFYSCLQGLLTLLLTIIEMVSTLIQNGLPVLPAPFAKSIRLHLRLASPSLFQHADYHFLGGLSSNSPGRFLTSLPLYLRPQSAQYSSHPSSPCQRHQKSYLRRRIPPQQARYIWHLFALISSFQLLHHSD